MLVNLNINLMSKILSLFVICKRNCCDFLVLGSVVASLPTDQEVPGLISDSAVGFFYNEKCSEICTY